MSRHLLPTPSLAVSITALVVAMGGTGYAATKLSGSNIKAGTITGKQIKSHSLGAGKLSAKTIAQLKGATGPAGPAGPAGAAGAAGARGPAGIVGFKTVGSDAVDVVPFDQKQGTAKCPAGTIVVGGGAEPSIVSPYVVVTDSYPDGIGSWTADVANSSGNSISFTVRAICVIPEGVGGTAGLVPR